MRNKDNNKIICFTLMDPMYFHHMLIKKIMIKRKTDITNKKTNLNKIYYLINLSYKNSNNLHIHNNSNSNNNNKNHYSNKKLQNKNNNLQYKDQDNQFQIYLLKIYSIKIKYISLLVFLDLLKKPNINLFTKSYHLSYKIICLINKTITFNNLTISSLKNLNLNPRNQKNNIKNQPRY